MRSTISLDTAAFSKECLQRTKLNQFYVDDITRELSAKYNVEHYHDSRCTLGESSSERFAERFMLFGKLMTQFVGVTMQQYLTVWPTVPEDRYLRAILTPEDWSGELTDAAQGLYPAKYNDYLDIMHRPFLIYRPSADEQLGAPAFREEIFHEQKYYVPTEPLIRIMQRIDYRQHPIFGGNTKIADLLQEVNERANRAVKKKKIM